MKKFSITGKEEWDDISQERAARAAAEEANRYRKKMGKKPDETFRQKDGERYYILNLVL